MTAPTPLTVAAATKAIDPGELESRIRRIDTRRDALTAELASGHAYTTGAGKKIEAIPAARRKQIEADLAELAALRADAMTVIDGVKLIAEDRRASLDAPRDRVIADADALVKTIVDTSHKADQLMRDLANVLQQRQQAVALLEPLLGAASIKKHNSRAAPTEALGTAGLRQYVALQGAPEGDRYSLRSHAEVIVASEVRGEVSRLKARGANHA